MSSFPEKDSRFLKPRTKRVYIISSITFAIHRGDVPFTIYNLNQKKLKTIYLIKKEKENKSRFSSSSTFNVKLSRKGSKISKT